MSERFLTTCLVAFAVLMVVAVAVWTLYQWHECRDYGFSVLYCLKHVA